MKECESRIGRASERDMAAANMQDRMAAAGSWSYRPGVVPGVIILPVDGRHAPWSDVGAGMRPDTW